MQRGTLSLRITVVLVASFVALQLGVFVLTSQAGRGQNAANIGLPTPDQTRSMLDIIEAVPPGKRAAAVRTFDGALYHVTVEAGDLPPSVESLQGMDIGQSYSAALPGHRLSVTGRVARVPAIARLNPWPGWLDEPLALHISLNGSPSSMLTIESQPSPSVLAILRERAGLLGLGGIVALIALALAVRATTGPIARLARDIRTFAGAPDTPDLAVSGSRELRDLAEAYNEMKGRIAELMAERTRVLAAIAHDMRTYITRVRLRSEFIDDPGQRARAARDLDEMAALLDDTLLLARAEAGAAEISHPIDLAGEVRRVAEIHCEMGRRVSSSTAVGAAPIIATPVAVRRILDNLIDNALRHADSVMLSLRKEGERWRVDVEDDGPGVAPDQISQLGQPFRRLDPSRDRTTGGAGLGLAIVRALVTGQGGEIVFANRATGGFIASFWLPVSDAGEQGPAPAVSD